jgi:Bacteriocin-protection, YdeI or OmpD-Associated/Domain of unknown function (DUF1905)
VAVHRFDAVLQQRGRGFAIEVPLDVPVILGEARPPVRGRVNGHPFQGRIAKYGGTYYLGFNREQREAAGIADGDTLEIELERDDEPRAVEVPEDLAAALEAADLRKTYDALAFTHRREYARWITEAKRDETRQRRVEKAIEMLRAGVTTPG